MTVITLSSDRDVLCCDMCCAAGPVTVICCVVTVITLSSDKRYAVL